MTWSHKRQLFYLSIFLLIILAVASFFVLPKILKTPTCSDGKQNGMEIGIDCGGGCELVCKSDVRPLNVLWSRSFPVSKEIYNAVAYVENPNPDSGVQTLNYEFRLYDENNVFITLRQGKTFLGPNGSYVVLESGVNVGSRIPKRTSFSIIDNQISWRAVDKEMLSKAILRTSGETIDESSGTLRVEAELINDSLYELNNVIVTAFVFDKEDTVIAVSKTSRDMVSSGSSSHIIFTWSQSFSGKAVRVVLMPIVNPFTLSL